MTVVSSIGVPSGFMSEHVFLNDGFIRHVGIQRALMKARPRSVECQATLCLSAPALPPRQHVLQAWGPVDAWSNEVNSIF
jgi:hypothetical protein